jgi:hypothetical protein
MIDLAARRLIADMIDRYLHGFGGGAALSAGDRGWARNARRCR